MGRPRQPGVGARFCDVRNPRGAVPKPARLVPGGAGLELPDSPSAKWCWDRGRHSPGGPTLGRSGLCPTYPMCSPRGRVAALTVFKQPRRAWQRRALHGTDPGLCSSAPQRSSPPEHLAIPHKLLPRVVFHQVEGDCMLQTPYYRRFALMGCVT